MADHADRKRASASAKEAEATRRAEPGQRHEELETRPEVRAEQGYRAALNRRPALAAQSEAGAHLAGRASPGPQPVQRAAAPNRTGLPDRLKSGAEALSGISLDGVKVHYNSSKPAQLNAHAYAQGDDVHVAPGQERHLPHEAWHLVQQKQGRVRPTLEMKDGARINDDEGLEHEADVMGRRAAEGAAQAPRPGAGSGPAAADTQAIQRMILPVWNKKQDKEDFLAQGEKQSERLGHGKVINVDNYLVDKNLKGLGDEEDLHIIGHGNPATVAGMTPAALARLVTDLGLPKTYKGKIHLETCHSGTTIEDLEGSYAQRFTEELAKLRPDTEGLDSVSYKGGVILDDTFKGHEMMRVLREGVEMSDFKKIAAKAYQDAHAALMKVLDKMEAEDLNLYVDVQAFHQLNFLLYNDKISKLAEPAGGALTQYSHEGKVYEGIPDASPNTKRFISRMIKKARKAKKEIDDGPIATLDLGKR
jgi:hypothetical protein